MNIMNTKIEKLFDLKSIKNFSSKEQEDYISTIGQEIESGKRVVAHFACDYNNSKKIFTILSDDKNCKLKIYSAQMTEDQSSYHYQYPSLTPLYPQMHMFEREIYEESKIKPIGHPALKPVRSKLNDDHLHIEGDEIHEVAVGPVHAGIIEPGHFRFQCHGEKVFHLAISLGYQHRGIEQELINGPHLQNIHQIECVAGDTTIAHTWCFCENIENLSTNITTSTTTSIYGNLIRALMLELERLANHVGDLGALANDVGFLPTSSFCGRIRGDYLNLTAFICGNRFGRSMLTPYSPYGVNFILDNQQIDYIIKKINEIYRDTLGATNLLWNNSTVLSRFENTGIVDNISCSDLGIVGVAARASGVPFDNRKSYQKDHIPHYQQIKIATTTSCDVWARAYIRKLEIDESIKLIKLILNDLKELNLSSNLSSNSSSISSITLKPNHLAISLIEGWRGEVCHVAITNESGRLQRYKIIDPSFHNWMALAIALRGEEISDFPLCNKSFNLSYCGFDL
ncbi:MAG: NADH-quinone oxidoreductase subunit C [Oligoflexia bacterium]|nr:NADH-quinone oxidoreductase subunit C [Oligoflexia bacterium]